MSAREGQVVSYSQAGYDSQSSALVLLSGLHHQHNLVEQCHQLATG